MYFLTFTVVDWVDVFTRKEHRLKIAESLKYCQENKGLILYGWVIMSNHLHLITSAKEDFVLSDIIKAIDTEPESRREWMLYRFEYNAKYSNRNSKYKFWKEGNHAILLDSAKLMQQKLDYIPNNPVESMIVLESEEYTFSSAKQYAGELSLLNCSLIE